MNTVETKHVPKRWAAWVLPLVVAVLMPAWACGLSWLGAAFTGAGHGDYALVVIPFAPFSLWNSGAAFFLGLFMWGLVGLFTLAPTPRAVYPAILLLVVHYVGVAVLIFGAGRSDLGMLFNHLRKYADMQGIAWLWLFAYATVSLLLWSFLIFRFIRLRSRGSALAHNAKNRSSTHA